MVHSIVKPPEINCQFGKAQVGDVLPLPSPFKFGEILAKLVDIKGNGRFLIHNYELYLFGVLIGRAAAKQDGAYTEWRVM